MAITINSSPIVHPWSNFEGQISEIISPAIAGVYLLGVSNYRDQGPAYYVGQSTDLPGRLKTHRTGRYKPYLKDCRMVRIGADEYRTHMEGRFISAAKSLGLRLLNRHPLAAWFPDLDREKRIITKAVKILQENPSLVSETKIQDCACKSDHINLWGVISFEYKTKQFYLHVVTRTEEQAELYKKMFKDEYDLKDSRAIVRIEKIWSDHAFAQGMKM